MVQYLLVVDDEPATLLAFRRLFSGPETMVDTAETLDEAMARLGVRQYRVVVADLRLSGIHAEEGLEILKQVKAGDPKTGFVLITGQGGEEVCRRARDLGADYYFEKPISPSELRAALQFLGLGTGEGAHDGLKNGG